MTDAAPRHSAYRRLAANTGAAFAGRLAAIVLALIVSTVLFETLGPAPYGIWAFCYMLLGYQALFDLGLGATVERLVARAYYTSDTGQIARVLNQAMGCGAAIAVVLQGAVLAVPARDLAGVHVGLLRFVLPLSLLLSLWASITGAGLAGIQRLGRLNALRTAMNLVSTVALLLLVFMGVRRLEWLMLAHALGLTGASLLAWRSLRRELGPLAFGPVVWDRQLLHEFVRFGGAVQAASFGPQLADQAFRLVIGLRFGTPWMGYYDLGSRAAMVLRSFGGTLLVPLVPFGVQQELAGGTDALTRLFRITVKYTALWLLPGSAVALYHSPLLISLWLGESAESSHVLLVFQVFLVVNALAGVAAPVAIMARAAGVPGFEAWLMVAASSAAVMAALVVPGVLPALCVFGGLPVLGAYALWWTLRDRVGGTSGALRDLAGVAGITVVALILAYSLDRLGLSVAPGINASRLMMHGVLSGVLPVVAAVGLAWGLGLVSAAERQFLRSIGLVTRGAGGPENDRAEPASRLPSADQR